MFLKKNQKKNVLDFLAPDSQKKFRFKIAITQLENNLRPRNCQFRSYLPRSSVFGPMWPEFWLKFEKIKVKNNDSGRKGAILPAGPKGAIFTRQKF